MKSIENINNLRLAHYPVYCRLKWVETEIVYPDRQQSEWQPGN